MLCLACPEIKTGRTSHLREKGRGASNFSHKVCHERKMIPHRKHSIVCWFLSYALVVSIGFFLEFGPSIVLATLLVLNIPPLTMHLIACHKVIRRTKEKYPSEWEKVRGPLHVKLFLFDDRDFGDVYIARFKDDLQWWWKAGAVGIILYIPTLYVMSDF